MISREQRNAFWSYFCSVALLYSFSGIFSVVLVPFAAFALAEYFSKYSPLMSSSAYFRSWLLFI